MLIALMQKINWCSIRVVLQWVWLIINFWKAYTHNKGWVELVSYLINNSGYLYSIFFFLLFIKLLKFPVNLVPTQRWLPRQQCH